MVNICVVGLGAIGLPTAVVMASRGHQVSGVDIEESVVSGLNRGETHSDESGLSELLNVVVTSGQFKAAAEPVAADMYLICVPTSLTPESRPILDSVKSAAGSIGRVMPPGALVVLESTVPPGTTAGLVKEILEKTSGLQVGSGFSLAHCPERVLPGNIMREIVDNDRIIGGVDEMAAGKASEIYATFVDGELVQTDSASAEVVKLAENIYRDVNIAFANDLAVICEQLGVDVWEAIGLANLHPRVNIHQPGPGVGGYCVPLAGGFMLGDDDINAPVIRTARRVNDSQPARFVERIVEVVARSGGTEIAVLGVSYKGGVGDPRYSPSTEIIQLLRNKDLNVRVHDPLVIRYSEPLLSLEDAVRGADLVAVLVDHPCFKQIDAQVVAQLMRGTAVIDGRNVIDVNAWESAGLTVERLGAPRVAP